MKTTARFLLPALAVAAALTVFVACGDSEGTAKSAARPEAAAANDLESRGQLLRLTIHDFDALQLSATQRDEMQGALEKLNEGRRCLIGEGPGRLGRGDGPGMGEPPLIGFLESASKILTPDQFADLARLTAARRDEFFRSGGGAKLRERIHQGRGRGDVGFGFGHGGFGGGPGRELGLTEEQREKAAKMRSERIGDRVEWRLSHLDDHVGRRAEFLGRVLGLSEDQASEVRSLYMDSIPERTEVLEGIRSGAIEPEQAADRILTIEQSIAGRIESLLTPAQTDRWEAIRELVPGPLR
jgi:hypothetical protein